MSRRSLSSNAIWALLGNAVYALSQWAITVLLAKFGSRVMVGQFALAIALVSPLIVLAMLQLRGVLMTEVGARFTFADFVVLRSCLSVLAFAAALAIAWTGSYGSEQLLTVVGVGLWKLLDSVCDIHYGAWQASEDMKRVSTSLVLNGSVSILAVGAVLTMGGNVASVGFAAALGSVVTLVYVVGSRRSRAARPVQGVRPREVIRLALIAAPLGLVTGLLTLQASVPRYFVEHYAGAGELGLFAAASQLTLAGSNIVAALAAAASPRLARFHAARAHAEYRSLLGKLVATGASLGIAGAVLSWFAGATILRVVYRPEYASGAHLLVWLSAGAALSYAGSFLGYGMTFAGAIRPQAPLFFVVVAVTGAGCWAWVPRHGSIGAAAAMAAGALVQVIGSFVIIRSALRDGMFARERRAEWEANAP